MIIREIEEKDNQKMVQIIKRTMQWSGLDIPGTAYFDPQLSHLAEFYKNEPNAKYWVAVDEEGHVVGGVGIGPFGQENDVGELQKLYVIPEAQGKGLAKKLMEVALDFVREHYT